MLFKKMSRVSDHHGIIVYTLSDCRWCIKTLQFLNEKGVKYERVNVDPSRHKDYLKVVDDLKARNAPEIFPTTIIDGQTLITGHKPDELSQVLGL